MEEIKLAQKKVQCVGIYGNEHASGSMNTGIVFPSSTFSIFKLYHVVWINLSSCVQHIYKLF
jgi:hypothetical protein